MATATAPDALTYARVQDHLAKLKLDRMAAVLDRLAEEAATENWPYIGFLDRLLDEEVATRLARSVEMRTKLARFPFLKTLDQFDFSFQPSVDERRLRELATLRFVANAENVLLLGPPGVGKTHLAIALGVQACAARKRVLFSPAAELLDQLVQAQAAGLLAARLHELGRLNLLILDELGYLALDQNRANLFFQLISRLYEQGSVILTTNRRFEHWAGWLGGDRVIAGAVLDRLLHHRHLLAINGPSYRTPDLTGAGTPAAPAPDSVPAGEAALAQVS